MRQTIGKKLLIQGKNELQAHMYISVKKITEATAIDKQTEQVQT